MTKILKEQILKLLNNDYKSSTTEEQIESEQVKDIIFYKKLNNSVKKYKVIFEDYIVRPFEGFDFHDKFNHGNTPPSGVMYGIIIKETEKMYYFNLSTDSLESWSGWCPKKSCKVFSL